MIHSIIVFYILISFFFPAARSPPYIPHCTAIRQWVAPDRGQALGCPHRGHRSRQGRSLPASHLSLWVEPHPSGACPTSCVVRLCAPAPNSLFVPHSEEEETCGFFFSFSLWHVGPRWKWDREEGGGVPNTFINHIFMVDLRKSRIQIYFFQW